MKTLLFAFIAFTSISVHGACDKKVDAPKVMLFVDTNNSELEIATAEKAACERGEKLRVVPKNYKQYAVYTNKVNQASKNLNKSKCMSDADPKCKTLIDNYNKAYMELDAFKSKQPQTSPQVKEALDEIKKAKGKLQSVIISGHDGGGQFGGTKGSFGRGELSNMINEYQDINDVKSLMLLGCYTGTQFEVMTWKGIFPKTKIIAGYDGSAPLADRPQGHQYIHDILTKEKQLTKQADEKKLQAYVDNNIKGLSNLNAGLYLQCSNGTSEQSYYYGSKKNRKFEKVQVDECIEKAGELRDIVFTFQKYESGELQVPKDTQNGALRQLYNKARTYEHCGDVVGVALNVSGIFNMLFYEGVKQNFAEYYKDDLKEMEQYLTVDINEMEKTLNESLQPFEKLIEIDEALLQKQKEDFPGYIAAQEAEIAKLKVDEKTLEDPAYADLKDKVSFAYYGQIGAKSGVTLTEDQANKLNELQMRDISYRFEQQRLEYEKLNPQQAIAARESKIKTNLEYSSSKRVAFADMKKNLGDVKDKVWVPNAENLKKYSRADLMKNIHAMNKLQSLDVLNPKQRAAMSWLSNTTMNHLQAFANPFEWHEYTGKPVTPPNAVKLKDAINNPYSGFGGFGGFGGYTGGYGGGYSYPGGGFGFGGGMAGGTGGGYPYQQMPQQQQQPQQYQQPYQQQLQQHQQP